ncbi:hypothetical protein WL1483_3844 [Aeromonas schubertii]|uniref:Uncharacterized protein n=1 Tax=Aeromonas schubertii TaxID=652 RepID=A0A0S2SNF7_9GAMM|nr:hypothetical protein WL1483_3844 [Aeromonas schubertii]
MFENYFLNQLSRLLKSKLRKEVKDIDCIKQHMALSSSRYGGAMRDRTADLLRAKQALSQLSYSPV